MNKRKIAVLGVLTSLALVLAYIETLIPAFFAFPGMKIGLTNLAVLSALYLLDNKSALIINVIRIGIVALLFGNLLSFAFSIAGGVLSWCVMAIMKKSGKFGIVTVSIAGATAHNVGQILVAMAVFSSVSVAWYLVLLWFTGILTGAVIGVLGGVAVKRLKNHIEKT